MRRENKKRNKIIIGLISLLLIMTVGYAAFQTNLNIKGTSKISSNWDIRITGVTSGNKTGNAENAKTPTWTNLTASMEANLYEKGDAMEYEVTVENKGTFDAKLEDIITNIKSNNEAIKISFSGYTKGEKLYKNTSKVVNVKIEYNKDFEGTPPTNSSEVEITLDYGQAEGGTITPTNDYLVTYDCKTNGGEDCSKYNEYLSEGSKIDLSYTATKAGWTFAGWNTNKDATVGLSTIEMKNADVTLYAIYKKTINVSYTKGTGISAIGKTTDSCTMYNKATSCQITLPSITSLTGYGVDGWYNSSNTKVGTEGTKVNVNTDKTIYTAKGKANSYTLTYNYNGATGGNSTTSKAVTYNSTYGTLPTPTRSYVVTYNYNSATGGNTTANATSNYTFNGWYKESTFTNQVTSSTIYNTVGNSTIYAKWTGTSIVLPTPTRTGYTFSGWYSDSGLTKKVGDGGSSYTPTSSLTLYAKWTDTTKPTISLSPNTQTTYISGGKAVTVNLSDSGSGLKASQPIYYAWSTSNATVPSSWSSITSTNAAGAKSASVTVPATSNSSLTGTYYLWIKAGTLSDVSGNTSNQVVSALFKFDNKNPSLSVSTSKTTKSITAVATASATSGINKYEFSKDNGTTWINNGTNKTYTFTGLTHNTSYNIKVRVTSGVSRQNTSAVIATTTNIIPTPTYSSTNNGEVVISYPSGCGSTYTCTYIKDGGTPVTVTSNPTVYFGANGTLVAKVSDGVSTVSASAYSVVRNDLYVSSAGNDTTGYGTINKPYATIQKAYDSANTTATIKVMNDLSLNTSVQFASNKTITLTSYSTSSSINSIKRVSDTGDYYLIRNDEGTLNLKNIIIDGNNIASKTGLVIIGKKGILNMENGSTVQNANDVYYTGGGVRVDDGGAVLNLNGGSIINNKAPISAGVHVGVDSTLNINGGLISNNVSSGNAGGIGCHGNLNFKSGTISGNKAAEFGGGVYFGRYENCSTPTFTMSGGTITGNNAKQAGAIVMINDGYFNLSGGTITNNTGTLGNGGILTESRSGIVLTITGGTVDNNVNLNSEIRARDDLSIGTNAIISVPNLSSFSGNVEYKVLNKISGKALDVEGGIAENNRNVQIWDYAFNPQQKWNFIPSKILNGVVYYMPETSASFSHYLEVYGDSSIIASGSNVEIYSYAKEEDYYWYLTLTSDGWYNIKNKFGNYCLEAAGAGTANGTNAQLYTCNGTDAQKWGIYFAN